MISTLLYKSLLVALGFNLVILLRYALHSLSTQRAFKHVPGPSSSSMVWGEEWKLYHGTPGAPYIEWHRQFGKLVKFTGAFGHQVLSITDPRAISFILGEGAYEFPKPQGVRAWFKATLGEGILWVEGQMFPGGNTIMLIQASGKKAHEQQRRLLAPALNPQSVRKLTDVFFETSRYLANQWLKRIELNNGEEIEIEVTDWAGRFALDTVGRAAFSYDFDCLTGEPHALASALDGLTNNEHKRSSFYMRALFWIVPSILFIGKKGEMIRNVKSELGIIASKMWKEAITLNDKDSRNVMANMLRQGETSRISMDEEQIVSQMRTVLSAGYETVSAIVAWMLYEIASNQEFQSRLREEIVAIPDHSFDHLNNELPLLDAALKETLRLHPAILENHHEASETVILPLSPGVLETGDKGLVLPKGTTVVIPVNVLQTDQAVWGRDADTFRPERWLEMKDGQASKERELLAFSVGYPKVVHRKNLRDD
ncbi:hypothetical protein D9613_002072 [Agrocybe pediades]|uniref:Cytochrome P450 n=1 Tax=Agrocybe pediades TaxID=84607 RepID=A0A8H4R8Y3_9AGAR|nr:hypothetical protein D9613_002072 [Agrocybe pediades]